MHIFYRKQAKKPIAFSDIFSILASMKTVVINNSNIQINENCHIIDNGIIWDVEIDIAEWIIVEYCFIENETSTENKCRRHIRIQQNSKFSGTSVILNSIDLEIITEICGDNTTSTLDILALAKDNSHISVEWVVRVMEPYRHVSTRVDQTNILIGTGARVRWVPKLEINTDDIEGGHSCRVHRIGGEAVFYLTSRGLTEQHAETMLLNSEILRHLRTIAESEREKTCYGVHMRLKK